MWWMSSSGSEREWKGEGLRGKEIPNRILTNWLTVGSQEIVLLCEANQLFIRWRATNNGEIYETGEQIQSLLKSHNRHDSLCNIFNMYTIHNSQWNKVPAFI